MQYLRQSTSATVVIGPVWATADGVLKADLAYDAAGINCDIYKNGTKADITLANSAGDGYFRAASGEALYLLTLSTGHTDTLGRLEISLSATGYYMKPRSYMVVPANVWDSLFGADKLQVDVGVPSFTVASAVSASGDAIELVQGDDYANGDARALSWSSTSWPDLTSASVTLYVKQGAGVVDIAGSVVSAGGATQTVRVEPTAIETAALDAGMEKFHLEAVLDGGHVVTLAYGTVNVIADVST